MDHNVSDSSVPGILQARRLEWVAVPFSKGSSQPRDRTRVSWIAESLPPEPPGSPHRLLVWLILESKVINLEKTKLWDNSKQKTLLSISKQVKQEKQEDVLLMKLLASCPSEPRRDAQVNLSLASWMFGMRSQTPRRLHFQPGRSSGLRGGLSQEVTFSLVGLIPASRLQVHTLALLWWRHHGCFIRKWSGARQPDLGVPVRPPGHSLSCYQRALDSDVPCGQWCLWDTYSERGFICLNCFREAKREDKINELTRRFSKWV